MQHKTWGWGGIGRVGESGLGARLHFTFLIEQFRTSSLHYISNEIAIIGGGRGEHNGITELLTEA